MKRILAALAALLGLAVFEASAQDQSESFRSGEWDFSPFATYVDKAGGKWGVGASLAYFVTKRLGFGGATYWTDFSGTFFDNAEGEVYFRVADFKIVAPYAVASLGYQFDAGYWFETFGGGVDFRPFKKLTAFSDLQYRIANNDNSPNGIFLRLGVRLSF